MDCCSALQPFDEQAALQLLLAKETRLLQTLDKLRVNARKETKALGTQKLLGHLAQPKTWTLSNGKKVRVLSAGQFPCCTGHTLGVASLYAQQHHP
jgi:hypothetical protein